jgi:PilZ domain
VKHQVEQTLYSLSEDAPARPERRSGERYLSLLRVGALLMDGRRELCLVRNVSAGGMLIRPYSPVAEGTPVAVELKHGETVSGVAKWIEDGLVGIAFDQPIDVVALLTSPENGPQPRMPRIELNCTAWVREDADIYRTRTVNISQGGMCVEGDERLRVDTKVIVSLAGLGPIDGRVKWKESDRYGIGFNRVLAVNELMGFLRQQQRFANRCAVA